MAARTRTEAERIRAILGRGSPGQARAGSVRGARGGARAARARRVRHPRAPRRDARAEPDRGAPGDGGAGAGGGRVFGSAPTTGPRDGYIVNQSPEAGGSAAAAERGQRDTLGDGRDDRAAALTGTRRRDQRARRRHHRVGTHIPRYRLSAAVLGAVWGARGERDARRRQPRRGQPHDGGGGRPRRPPAGRGCKASTSCASPALPPRTPRNPRPPCSLRSSTAGQEWASRIWAGACAPARRASASPSTRSGPVRRARRWSLPPTSAGAARQRRRDGLGRRRGGPAGRAGQRRHRAVSWARRLTRTSSPTSGASRIRRFAEQGDPTFVRAYGYERLMAEAARRVLAETGVAAGDQAGRRVRARRPARRRPFCGASDSARASAGGAAAHPAGIPGVASPLLALAACLEQAEPGDRILLVGYGSGADALLFEATGASAGSTGREAWPHRSRPAARSSTTGKSCDSDGSSTPSRPRVHGAPRDGA